MKQNHPEQETANPNVDSIDFGDDKRLAQKIGSDNLLELDPLEEALLNYAQNSQHRGAVR